jgi:hypothetical protein
LGNFLLFRCFLLLPSVLPPAERNAGVDTPSDTLNLPVIAEETAEGQGEEDLLEVDAAFIIFNFASPAEEVANVLGHLGDGGGGAIFVLEETVGEGRGHGEDAALEVGIPELTGLQGGNPVGDAEGLSPVVASEEREDVVDTTEGEVLTNTEGDGTQIRGFSTVVGELGRLGVGVGHGKPVGGLTLADFVLAFRVGDGISDFLLSGELLDFFLGHEGLEVVVGEALERVARGEDLRVDLTTATNGVPVHTSKAVHGSRIVLSPVPVTVNRMCFVTTHFFFLGFRKSFLKKI